MALPFTGNMRKYQVKEVDGQMFSYPVNEDSLLKPIYLCYFPSFLALHMAKVYTCPPCPECEEGEPPLTMENCLKFRAGPDYFSNTDDTLLISSMCKG